MKRLKPVLTFCVAAALVAVAHPPSQADASLTAPATADAQVAQWLTDKSPAGTCSVIAVVDGAMTPAQAANLNSLHAEITNRLTIIHSIALTLPAANLKRLAALPFVTHLSYDGPVKKCDAFTVGSSGAGTAYTQYGLDGTGVTVAVVDSGVTGTKPTQTSHDLSTYRTGTGSGSRILARAVFCDNDSITTDDCGHGTHVGGIIAGNGYGSTGSSYFQTFYGIARNANLVSVKVLDGDGIGNVSNVVAGIQWVISNKAAYNIRVLNLSLGHPVGESSTTDPLCQTVEQAWKAGIVVVCAAGNNGRVNLLNIPLASNEGWGTNYGSIQSPANDPYVITVGATKSMDSSRAHDKIATYSSRGPSVLDLTLKPDIIAPGNRVISVDANNSYLDLFAGGTNQIPMALYSNNVQNLATSDNYFCLSGTSMASPVVAGAAALMLQKDSTLTPDAIKARLMVSADKWADPLGNADPLTYGAGYLNIPAALASTVTVTQAALSPKMKKNADGTVSVDTTVIGSKAITGVYTIWGSKAISGVNTIYGSKSISGVSTVASSKAVSGVNSVASSKAVCGTSLDAAVDLSNVAVTGE